MRVGIFQCSGGGLDQAQRLERLEASISSQKLELKPDLVICPELFLSGYNVGQDVAAKAERKDGPFAASMADIAVRHQVALAYGYPERDGDSIYNAALCIDAAGQTVANQRKLVLPPGYEQDWFKAGRDLVLFDLQGVRCAILICYDAEFPENVRMAAQAGAQMIIAPTALVDQWHAVAFQMMPTRAFENGVWLAYANHAGEENGMCFLGCSCIVAPDGSDAARAGEGEELISALVDSASVDKAQARLPYLKDLQYLQPDLIDSSA